MIKYSKLYIKDSANSLPCVGKGFRWHEDKVFNYRDDLIYSYLDYIGDSNSYDSYGVIPKTVKVSRQGIGRYDQPIDPVSDSDKVYMSEAIKWVAKDFKFYSGSSIINLDAAISASNPSATPGYPWSLVYSSKEEYFCSDDFEFFHGYWDRLGTSDPLLTFTTNCVKVEMRPIEKVISNKGRTISAKDVNHILAHTMLFQDQDDRLLANCLDSVSCLGLDLKYGGAQRLHDSVMLWGDVPTCLSIDGNKYDCRFHAFAFDLIYNMKYMFMHPQFQTVVNSLRVKNLSKQIYDRIVVDIDGYMYHNPTGNDSGQKNTTVNNIEKNDLDWITLWLMVMPKSYHDYRIWKKLVVIKFVGDDVLMSVDPVIHHLWNADVIEKNMHRIGMVYEFENKQYQKFDNVTFVGHKFSYQFIPHLGVHMWLPQIDCNKMRESQLKFNESAKTPEQLSKALEICSGLRAETFCCDSCRKWFHELWFYLYSRIDDGVLKTKANNLYKTDHELWSLYTTCH